MKNKVVLVIAAHPDDEALGCGGTIAQHAATGDTVQILFVADGESSRGATELEITKRRQASVEAAKALGTKPPIFLPFADQRLDTVAILDITQAIERATDSIKPTIVYTHHHGDLNKDHRLVNEAVLTAFRPIPGQCVRAIYGFEVLSSTEWAFGTTLEPFAPAHFRDINTTIKQKITALRCYDHEMRSFPHPRSYETVEALAKLRGSQVGCSSAEAFTVIRQIV